MGLPNRQSIRLSGYDYSQNGYYFITICTQDRKCLFGSIVGADQCVRPISDNIMKLNEIGKMVNKWLKKIPEHFVETSLNIYQIMPNHIHGIIIIKTQIRAIHESPLQNTLQNTPQKRSLLSQIIGYFKMNSTKQIRKLKNCHNLPVWQRNYYEHIIRNQIELNKIREYIKSNPLMWERDRNNPTSLGI